MSIARPKNMLAPWRRRGPALAGMTLLFACGLLVTGMAGAQTAGNSLQDVQVQALPGNRVELRLIMQSPAAAPLAFTIDDPARIALDLQDTSLALPTRRKDVGVGVLDTVLAAEASGRTRIVLNLDQMVAYQTRVEGNSIVVTLDNAGTVASRGQTFAAAAPSSSSAGMAGDRRIDNVDFRRSETGAGRIIVTMSDPGTAVDVRREGEQVVVNFTGASVTDDQTRRLDVLDFATPVSTVDVLRAGGDTRLVIAATGSYEELAYQSDNVFTVEIQKKPEPKALDKPTMFSPDREYSGERLTLNFQDIETRAVLQLLADVSGRNVVVSDTVQGNVTLRLQNVPWDQALDIVLAAKGLDMRENGNVIIVAPAEEIAARELADLESRQEIQSLEPLQTEYLQVNYAKAADLAVLIQGQGGNALLSERGSVGIDERTNTLLLQDTAGRIGDIRRLVTTLDIPVRQVLIESRIVIVSDDFARDLGIRWGATGVRESGDTGLVSVTGSAQGNQTIVTSAVDNVNNTGTPFPVALPSLDDRFIVDVPVGPAAGQLAVAVLSDDFLIDLELSALQAEGRGEVVSSPRVITANQKEAVIKQGVEIPFQEAASSGATATQFKEAVLSLTVTPQITPDDRVILDLLVTKDSVGDVITTERGGSVPSIDTRSVQTQVLVDNGQTVVLGGIYETEQNENVTKVPYLGDIPWVGGLFRSTRIQTDKSELLVFVTPKILKEGSNIY